MSFPLTLAMFPVSSLLIWEPPKPVTTTSESDFVSVFIETCMLPPFVVAWADSYPTALNNKVLPAALGMLKPPEASVLTPVFSPLTKTVTPTIGAPFSSVTFPVTVVFCAKATAMKSRKATIALSSFLIIYGWF